MHLGRPDLSIGAGRLAWHTAVGIKKPKVDNVLIWTGTVGSTTGDSKGDLKGTSYKCGDLGYRLGMNPIG